MNETNIVKSFGDDIPGLNLLPEQLRSWVLIALVLVPLIGRAYKAVANGGGLRGIWSAIVYGTNTPKPPTE